MPLTLEKKASYLQALCDSSCREEARETFEKRRSEFRSFSDHGALCNMATVRLNFSDGTHIQITARSIRVQDATTGHSERRALALAINQAISEGKPGFVGLNPVVFYDQATKTRQRFTGRDNSPIFDDLHKNALSSLSSIKIYTEREPCLPCKDFLGSTIPSGVDCIVCFSIESMDSTAMSKALFEQFEAADKMWDEILLLESISFSQEAVSADMVAVPDETDQIALESPPIAAPAQGTASERTIGTAGGTAASALPVEPLRTPAIPQPESRVAGASASAAASTDWKISLPVVTPETAARFAALSAALDHAAAELGVLAPAQDQPRGTMLFGGPSGPSLDELPKKQWGAAGIQPSKEDKREEVIPQQARRSSRSPSPGCGSDSSSEV